MRHKITMAGLMAVKKTTHTFWLSLPVWWWGNPEEGVVWIDVGCVLNILRIKCIWSPHGKAKKAVCAFGIQVAIRNTDEEGREDEDKGVEEITKGKWYQVGKARKGEQRGLHTRWPAVEDVVQECEDHSRAAETERAKSQREHGKEGFQRWSKLQAAEDS